MAVGSFIGLKVSFTVHALSAIHCQLSTIH
jgi:hypothetical protein